MRESENLSSRNKGFEEILEKTLEMRGISAKWIPFDQLHRFYTLLIKWQKTINLTAIKDPDEIADRHFAESLFILPRISRRGQLLDIGSGNGFPALPIKIAFPELKLVMVEGRKRKCHFLNAAVRELGLKDVEIINCRLNRLSDIAWGERFDYLTMRGVRVSADMLIDFPSILKKNGRAFIYAGRSDLSVLDQPELTVKLRHEEFLLPGRRSSFVSVIEIA
ncbi:MAG: 16S rRNA (guanine(527)-N(7))-methyltransferase RsmG [Acidobacteriota bacterium]